MEIAKHGRRLAQLCPKLQNVKISLMGILKI